MKKWKIYLIAIIITVSVGFLASIINNNGIVYYDFLNKPKLTPPNWVFGVVWTVLYMLMGISIANVIVADKNNKKSAIQVFCWQLFYNFWWSIWFFNFRLYLFSFVWLIILLVLIVIMIIKFYRISKSAAYLQIPYLLWVMFAGYLNIAIYILN